MTEKVPELTNGEFEEFIKKGVALIDFFAEWCMPCIMMSSVVEEVADALKGKARIGKVDVGENESIAQKFNVSSIPNFIIFKDGEPVEQFVGSMSAEDLEEKIKRHL
jgi:thioredoxin 1